MRRHVGWRLVAAWALLLGCIAGVHAQGLTVAAISVDGQSAQTAAGVQVRAPGATARQAQTLSMGEAIASGTEITLPRGARIELTSSNGNRITLHAGARFMAGTVTAQGESHQPLAGRMDFQIRKALDFFNIQYDRITAAVKGTEYTVEIDPGQTLTLSVTEGVVEVEREVQMRFAEAPRAGGSSGSEDDDDADTYESGIRVAEELKAGQRKTYRLNVEEYLTEFKNYGEAETYFRNALTQAEASKDRRRILRSVLNLMEMYWKIGKLPAAAELEGRCVALAKALADSAGEAACLNQAGLAYFELGDFRKAVSYFEQSMAINGRLYGGRDWGTVAANLNNLAITYRFLGEHRKAVEYNEKALAMRERLMGGRDHLKVAMSLNNLGRAYGDLGEHRKAIEYHEKALAMLERIAPGRDHPAMGLILNHLGLVYRALGDHSRAVQYHERALAVRERVFVKRDHPHIAASYSNLGFGYFSLGENRKAIEYLEKSLAMRERVYVGGDHPTTAATLHNLGRAYGAAGEHRAAISSLEKGLAMRERLFGPKDNRVAQSMRTLANAHEAAGNFPEARRYRQGAQGIDPRFKSKKNR